MEKRTFDKFGFISGLLILLAVFIIGLSESHKLKQNQSSQLVKITLKAIIKDAQEVKIAGSFNNWQARCCLEKVDNSNTWKIQLQLQPGVYEYIFLVDGVEWLPDHAKRGVSDGMGGRNGVFYVNKTTVKQGDGNV